MNRSQDVCAPVCVPRAYCGMGGVRYREGWSGFAFPPGVRYLRNQSCRTVPRELGVDHVWLPVTNCWTMRPPVGHWFYYMRGCSDWAWNVGRTVLVRNRCDAALALRQRLAQNASRMLGRTEAAQQVAAYVRASYGNGTAVWRAAKSAQTFVSKWKGRPVTFAEAVLGCADGVYAPDTEECNEALAQKPDPSRTSRAQAYSYVAGHNMLDFHNMAIAQSLRGTLYELDTMQMWQQPQGGGAIEWTTEIWDVRPITRCLNDVCPLS